MKKDIRMMKAVAAAVLGNSFFGLSFLFSKVALERLEPFVLLAVRFIVAFVMLNLVLLTGKVKIRLTGKPFKKSSCLGWCSRFFILHSKIMGFGGRLRHLREHC